MKTIFITGFPGFLAQYLTRQLIADHQEKIAHIYFLVLPRERKKAEATIRAFQADLGENVDFFTVIEGDITKADIGLNTSNEQLLLQHVTHVFHLAAIYDLAVPEAVAELVNVAGTNNINQFVKRIEKLERYIYFSTAYVSGKREGKIYESELDKGQFFRNHYERTKFDAEVFVQQLKEEVPTTIIRPGVVKGHSITGETIKFDGLYFMLNFYDRLRFMPFIPYLKQGTSYPEGNFVPSDYVLKATSYLAMHPVGEDKTYHLTDPNPYHMDELQEMLVGELLGRRLQGVLPISVAKMGLRFRALRNWLRVENEAMDYFTYHSSYDTSNAKADLADSGIVCPDLKNTLASMIQFYQKYKDDHTKHLPIFFE